MLPKNSLLTFWVFMLIGCSDHEGVDVFNGDFYYVDMNGYQRVIVNVNTKTIVVPGTVISYFEYDDSTYVIRNKVELYNCVNGNTATEVTRELEYWVINENSVVTYESKEDFDSYVNGKIYYYKLMKSVDKSVRIFYERDPKYLYAGCE